MLTGVTTIEDVQAAPPEERPTEVVADAAGLAAALERLSREG